MVTAEQMRAAYELRASARAEADAAEAKRVRALLPEVARELVRQGATEVYLFGSLAQGRFHASSDVDLATRGLDYHAALKAISTCGDSLDRAVDVVRLEDAPPTLVDRVTQTGVRLA